MYNLNRVPVNEETLVRGTRVHSNQTNHHHHHNHNHNHHSLYHNPLQQQQQQHHHQQQQQHYSHSNHQSIAPTLPVHHQHQQTPSYKNGYNRASPIPSIDSDGSDISIEANRSRMRWIISLGLLLPALAAVIGVVAWAVSAELVMSTGRDITRIKDGYRSLDSNYKVNQEFNKHSPTLERRVNDNHLIITSNNKNSINNKNSNSNSNNNNNNNNQNRNINKNKNDYISKENHGLIIGARVGNVIEEEETFIPKSSPLITEHNENRRINKNKENSNEYKQYTESNNKKLNKHKNNYNDNNYNHNVDQHNEQNEYEHDKDNHDEHLNNEESKLNPVFSDVLRDVKPKNPNKILSSVKIDKNSKNRNMNSFTIKAKKNKHKNSNNDAEEAENEDDDESRDENEARDENEDNEHENDENENINENDDYVDYNKQNNKNSNKKKEKINKNKYNKNSQHSTGSKIAQVIDELVAKRKGSNPPQIVVLAPNHDTFLESKFKLQSTSTTSTSTTTSTTTTPSTTTSTTTTTTPQPPSSSTKKSRSSLESKKLKEVQLREAQRKIAILNRMDEVADYEDEENTKSKTDSSSSYEPNKEESVRHHSIENLPHAPPMKSNYEQNYESHMKSQYKYKKQNQKTPMKLLPPPNLNYDTQQSNMYKEHIGNQQSQFIPAPSSQVFNMPPSGPIAFPTQDFHMHSHLQQNDQHLPFPPPHMPQHMSLQQMQSQYHPSHQLMPPPLMPSQHMPMDNAEAQQMLQSIMESASGVKPKRSHKNKDPDDKRAVIDFQIGDDNQPAESSKEPDRGLTLHFGGGPMGGGGQVMTNPIGILKTLLLPIMPKPRVNLNGKVVFGVVLEKGVGFGKQKKQPMHQIPFQPY